ncbi:MAG TPA: hypothetical protein VH817_13805 [Thermoleophilaceae bacterium]|jgi:hypothetical protein
MADRVLHISWGSPIPGREERGLEVFNEAMGFYGRLQQEGRIESFDVALFGANSDLNGYIVLHGSHEQLDAAQEDEEFQRVTVDASLVVADLRIAEALTNEGVAEAMGRYQEAISKVPQSA